MDLPAFAVDPPPTSSPATNAESKPAQADPPQSEPEDPPAAETPRGTVDRLKLSGRKLRDKQRQVQAVVLLFMGVVLLGVFLFAAILLSGSWVRRINRRPIPPMKRGDELWYLKHPPGLPPSQNSSTDAPPPGRTPGLVRREEPPTDNIT